MGSPRQTVSYLTARFRESGLEPDHKLGQNFLIDLNLVQYLADAADLGPQDVVLEVGTGAGSLTALLAERAGHVVTVELDQRLYELAQEILGERENVTMLRQDVLKNKNRVAENVLEEIRTRMAAIPDARFKLAANLPYVIATPLMSNLLRREPVPYSMTVTIQKELAERIAAQPSTKDYSGLTVWMQALCEVEILKTMGPGVFWPRPKVDSAIIQIRPIPEKRARIPDTEFFHHLARALFFHRRKFLRSVLISAFKGMLEKEHVDEAIAELGYDANARAEELPVEELLRMSEAFRRKVLAVRGNTDWPL